MKILHAADLHLDSPLRGLERYEGAPVAALREATRRALAQLVDVAREEQVSLLLIAGDLFDGDWRDYGTGLAFAREMFRLREADIRVIVVRGNHDAESNVTRNLALPSNVRVLSSDAPETVVLEDLGVAIHGQSFASPKITHDLAQQYPKARSSYLNFGLLHTALGGGFEGHENYAPTSPEVLIDKGYDYWALGHVHTQKIIRVDPYIVFPGNLQGRHIRETGKKGAVMIRTEGSRIVEVAPRHVDVVRYADLVVEVDESDGESEMRASLRTQMDAALADADKRMLALRVTLRGGGLRALGAFTDPERLRTEVRAVGVDAAGDGIWVGDVRFEMPAARRAAQATSGDALEHLLGSLGELCENGIDDAMRKSVEEIFAKLPREVESELRLLVDDAPSIGVKVRETILAALVEVTREAPP